MSAFHPFLTSASAGTTPLQKRFGLRLPFEVCIMICQRVHCLTAASGEKLQLLGSIFKRLWCIDEAAPFARLIKGIDDAVIRQRCHSRIVRLHRMLERDYAR